MSSSIKKIFRSLKRLIFKTRENPVHPDKAYTRVLILDGNSEHVAQRSRKIYIFGEKINRFVAAHGLIKCLKQTNNKDCSFRT